ncbi:MAG TPA: ABC transporter ATP-binding protein [Opitutaceae bacterium]|nr:ABC transporter ATP-binding protein [Opitutaceae bacterium]
MRRFQPYLKYLRMVRAAFFGALFCGLLYGAANGAGLPLMIKKVFPQIFAASAAPLTTLQLFLIALWLPAVFLVRGVAGYLNSYLIQFCGVRVLEALRLEYFEKLQRLPLSFLQRQSTGDLISRGLADTNQLQFTLTTVANEIFKQPTTLVGSLAVLIWLAFAERGVALVLVCLAIVPLCVLPIGYVGKKIIKRAQQVQSQLGSVTDRFNENLHAAREVRAFGLEAREGRRFAGISRALVTAQMKVAKYAQALTPAIEIISAVGISITLVYAYRVKVPLESFLAILTALYASYEPIKKLGALNSELKRGTVALDRLEVVLREPVTITDPARPVAVSRLRGDLAFTGVTFAYNSDVPALRGVTVAVPAGTVCALVGPSGAGKSTFANLVPRFYDVGTGAVTIDGIDVRAMRLADLRRNIALVSQDPVLFNDTVYNNLLLGWPDAARDQVIAAATGAHADEFIRALPQGYDTMVGERGTLLSGGQKQRLAVARAFLRNAPVLILDEATSALDSESEAAVQDALRRLVVGKTVLIIAHRFSTIRIASLILVFDRGEIVARGTHASLYAGNALYRSLYDRQQGAGA